MAIVVGTSVAATWGLPREAGSGAGEHVLRQLGIGRGLVPGIFWYEIRNVMLNAERRGRIGSGHTEDFIDWLGGLIEDDSDHNQSAVLGLARDHRLTVYDAAYLETALRRQAALATIDAALAAAARSSGVANPADAASAFGA